MRFGKMRKNKRVPVKFTRTTKNSFGIGKFGMSKTTRDSVTVKVPRKIIFGILILTPLFILLVSKI